MEKPGKIWYLLRLDLWKYNHVSMQMTNPGWMLSVNFSVDVMDFVRKIYLITEHRVSLFYVRFMFCSKFWLNHLGQGWLYDFSSFLPPRLTLTLQWRIMSAMTSQIICFTIVYSTVYSGADQRKHQSSASLALVRGIHWWPVNSPHRRSVKRKMFRFADVIMSMTLFLSGVSPIH